MTSRTKKPGADKGAAFRPFDSLFPDERAGLIRSFSGQESVAREFWDEIGNEIELAQMFGCGWDLQMTRSGATATEVKSSMLVVYNSCRKLLKALDAATCNHLVHPPTVERLSSLQREERQLKLKLLRSLLHEVAADADPDNGWDKVKPLRFRLDYMLASKILQEVEFFDGEHRLSARALVTLVFDILHIETDARDAIDGGKLIFS